MSADSKPSSMDAQNGSAYSNGGSYLQYQHTCPPTHRDPNTSEYRDEGSSAVDYDRSRRNGGYQNHPPSHTTTPYTQRNAHHQGYAGQAYYFPPDQTYTQQPARYENNLAFDGDQNGTPASSGYTGQTTHYYSSYDPRQPPSEDHYNTHGNSQSNTQHSLPTQRWSAEISPEERLRLGLPRYESEEQRLAYENAGVQTMG